MSELKIDCMAREEYTDSVCVESWCCENCGGSTYDDSHVSVPQYCCRCGLRFSKHVYKDENLN